MTIKRVKIIHPNDSNVLLTEGGHFELSNDVSRSINRPRDPSDPNVIRMSFRHYGKLYRCVTLVLLVASLPFFRHPRSLKVELVALAFFNRFLCFVHPDKNDGFGDARWLEARFYVAVSFNENIKMPQD